MASDRSDQQGLRRRIEATVAARVSPERTRRATMSERLTVSLLPWRRLVQINRALEILGKIATTVWVVTVAAIILFGLDVRDTVAQVFNAGRPVEGLIAAAILIPTIIFLLLRSGIGYCRWRVQRELWRRDVRRLTRVAEDAGLSPDELVAVYDKTGVLDTVISRISAVARREQSTVRDDEPGPGGSGVSDAVGLSDEAVLREPEPPPTEPA